MEPTPEEIKFFKKMRSELLSEYEPLALRTEALKKKIDALTVLISPNGSDTSAPTLFSLTPEQPPFKPTELYKYPNETWEDYVLRMFKYLGRCKSLDVKELIRDKNPKLEMSYINKVVDKQVAVLKMDKKLSTEVVGRGGGHGYIYTATNS